MLSTPHANWAATPIHPVMLCGTRSSRSTTGMTLIQPGIIPYTAPAGITNSQKLASLRVHSGRMYCAVLCNVLYQRIRNRIWWGANVLRQMYWGEASAYVIINFARILQKFFGAKAPLSPCCGPHDMYIVSTVREFLRAPDFELPRRGSSLLLVFTVAVAHTSDSTCTWGCEGRARKWLCRRRQRESAPQPASRAGTRLRSPTLQAPSRTWRTWGAGCPAARPTGRLQVWGSNWATGGRELSYSMISNYQLEAICVSKLSVHELMEALTFKKW